MENTQEGQSHDYYKKLNNTKNLGDMDKIALKFFVGALILALLGWGVIFSINYYNETNNSNQQAEQYYNNLQQQYQNDPYGGSTPEETLRLFIDALKKDDIELAAKFFVIDEQIKWGKNLAKIKDNNLLDEMITDLQKAKRYRSSSNDQVFFTAGNAKGEAAITLDLVKIVNKWKIRNL